MNDDHAIENDWAGHLMTIETIAKTIAGMTRCKGFAGAGLCFGCSYCYKGLISDEFAYVLGGGKIRLYAHGEVPELIDEALSVGTKNYYYYNMHSTKR